jgi:hypothetical protein
MTDVVIGVLMLADGQPARDDLAFLHRVARAVQIELQTSGISHGRLAEAIDAMVICCAHMLTECHGSWQSRFAAVIDAGATALTKAIASAPDGAMTGALVQAERETQAMTRNALELSTGDLFCSLQQTATRMNWRTA